MLVHLPVPQVAWLNNPEKDKDYAHLQGDMTHILNMYPGRLNPMAANLFFLTVIGDPLSPEATNMAKIMTTVRTRSEASAVFACVAKQCV